MHYKNECSTQNNSENVFLKITVFLPLEKLLWKVEEHWKWKGERSNENFVGHDVSCHLTGVEWTVNTN